MRTVAVIILSVLLTLYAQDSTRVNYKRLSIAAGTASAVSAGSYLILQNAWWKGTYVPFHFDDGTDLKYVKNMDKIGHFFGGYVTQDAVYNTLVWSNIKGDRAIWYSYGLSSFVQVMIDVKDGFVPSWGFSAWDVVTGTAGAGYRALQYKYPALQDYKLKMSYYYKEKEQGQKFLWDAEYIIEDYASQTYWLTFPVKYFPDWLGLAAGLSIDEYYKDYQAYLSFDIDLEKLSAPVNSRALSTIAHYLNFLKFPAPAIKFQPELKGYWIYY